jgi:hypothetical protein
VDKWAAFDDERPTCADRRIAHDYLTESSYDLAVGRTAAAAMVLCFISCQSSPRFVAVEVAPQEQPSSAKSDRTATPVPSGVADQAVAPELRWHVLRGLNVKTGETTPAVAALEGKTVRLRGYVVPFEDSLNTVVEFLLVPSAGMCVHTPPPPANQMVLVRATSGTPIQVKLSQPVEVTGALQILMMRVPTDEFRFG